MLQPVSRLTLNTARIPLQALELCLRTPDAQVGMLNPLGGHYICTSESLRFHIRSLRACGSMSAAPEDMLMQSIATGFRDCKRIWHVLLAMARWLLPLRQPLRLCPMHRRVLLSS